VLEKWRGPADASVGARIFIASFNSWLARSTQGSRGHHQLDGASFPKKTGSTAEDAHLTFLNPDGVGYKLGIDVKVSIFRRLLGGKKLRKLESRKLLPPRLPRIHLMEEDSPKPRSMVRHYPGGFRPNKISLRPKQLGQN